MRTCIYEKMTNEELKKVQMRIDEILCNRQNEKLQKAQQVLRDLIQEYAEQNISFYLNDGYGGQVYIYVNDIFAEKR